MNQNPFNLQFGKRPRQFLAREELVNNFISALDDENSHERESLLVGIRGIGKTTLLSDIAELVRQREDWIVISSFGNNHLTKDLSDALNFEYRKRFPTKKLLGITLGLADVSLGASFERPSQDYGFSTTFRILIEAFDKEKIGVLFLIDELVNEADVRDFLSNYQILLRENRKMAMLLAGLPNNVSSVLTNKMLTFLWRINRLEIGSINTRLIYYSYQDIFSNFEVKDDLLLQAAEVTEGYPYLYQLIGYYLFNFSQEKQKITGKSLERAIEMSRFELFDKVLKLMYLEMSPKDQEIYRALAKLSSPMRFSDVASLVKKSKNYVAQYRLRLLELGVIREAGYGLVEFTIPFSREFLERQ